MNNFYHSRDINIDSVTLPAADTMTPPYLNGHIMEEAIAEGDRAPAVSFIARSGTGKTTLLTSLIAELKRRGFLVGAVKHGPPNFEIDHPGKDSYRFTEAGADNMLVCSDNKLAFVKQYRQPPPFEDLLAAYFPDVDIILVEGFKLVDLPRIEIHRWEHGSDLLCRGEIHDPNLLAVATDRKINVDAPQLDLNCPEQIVEFLIHTFNIAPINK